MAAWRSEGPRWRGTAALAALILILGTSGCGLGGENTRLDGAVAALLGVEPTATNTPTAAPAATAVPTEARAAAAPSVVPTNTSTPTGTPRPTGTPTPTIADLVGPAVPWLTVQAYTSTPRPAYVAATPPEGPAVATIPPRPFAGSPAPTWTPAPTALPVLPGQLTPGTPSAPSGPVLELLSVADFVDAATGEFVVTGEVRNISDRVLSGVRAVVNLYDAQDRLLGSASEGLVFPSLKPDQRSPFAVAQADRQGRARFTVQFLDAEGKLIETVDSTG